MLFRNHHRADLPLISRPIPSTARAGRPGIDRKKASFAVRSPAFRPGLVLTLAWRRVFAAIFACSIVIASAGAQDQNPIAVEGKPPATEKVTYLGITTKAVDADLQSQLKLPDGVGLVVTFVDSQGPAAADIQRGDVLQKLDDQILMDTHQLVTLVRLHHAGDTVTLSIIHQAKPTAVKIKLGEKEHHVVGPQSDADPDHSYTLPGLPSPDFDYQLPTTAGQSVSMLFNDGVYFANVNPDKDGIRQMIVKDKTGTIVAHGPVDTQEQWDAIPDDIRKHLDVLHRMLFKKDKR